MAGSGGMEKPLEGANLSSASTSSTHCPLGLRAKRVSTRKYLPHTWRATRRKRSTIPTTSSAHHTIPNGKTLDSRLNAKGYQLSHNPGAREAPQHCYNAPQCGLSPQSRSDSHRGIG
ncbi:Hypothetical predicted protein [Pelobates cultripes]|uniref:Uncharacterized protein n=1 Tax=Pelobates cultripes TaxID=61616 RepID=A0AAD1VUC7_PELCU|nr:Hypothetical predicted protein [Pelobates cultripes]